MFLMMGICSKKQLFNSVNTSKSKKTFLRNQILSGNYVYEFHHYFQLWPTARAKIKFLHTPILNAQYKPMFVLCIQDFYHPLRALIKLSLN